MWSSLTISTFLFLSFFAVELAQNPGSVSDVTDSYPPFWDQINGDIAEFPVQNNKTIIDIWKYMDRLQMYKILITETNKYFTQFGQNNTGNVLWGITLFYGQLYRTDRLSEPSNTSMCAYEAGAPGCISINTGWAGINFYVIVMYFFAAIDSGFLRNVPHEVELLPQEEYRPNFCYSIEECRASYPQAMYAAKRFYQYLQSRKQVSIVGDSPVYDTDQDAAIFYMWVAHQAIIHVGKPKFSDISQYSSATERDFTEDLLIAMDFCEVARYRSHFESSAEFLVSYPHRLLTDQDAPILSNNFSIQEKALLASVKLISTLNKITGGGFFTIWKILNSSEQGRVLGRFIIKRLFLLPSL